MKIICRFFVLLFVCAVSLSFGQSMIQVQNDLEFHYQLIDHWRAELNIDSATAEDAILRERLLYYTNTYPKTLQENFKYLKYYGHMGVLTSDDRSFRIYSWDDGNNEHHNFVNVFQYNTGDKVEAALTMPGVDAEALKGRGYRNLYTLKTKGRVYYLATYVIPRSKDDYSIGMDVFSKDPKGGLNDSTQIIVNNTYGTAVNNLEYNMENASGATHHSIYFNNSNKMLYVPIIWKDGVVSNAYTIYRFKNNYFTEVTEEKKKK
jgi:hypothetical protein